MALGDERPHFERLRKRERSAIQIFRDRIAFLWVS
jgi:hypothetical protein